MWYVRGPSMEPMVANNTCRTQEAVYMQPFANTMLNMRLPQAVDRTTSSKPSTLVVSSRQLDQNLQKHHCKKTHLPLSLSCCYLTSLSHTDHTVAVGLATLHHFTSTANSFRTICYDIVWRSIPVPCYQLQSLMWVKVVLKFLILSLQLGRLYGLVSLHQ